MKHPHKQIATADGTVLERRYAYLKPSVWSAVEALAAAQNRSISSVIETALDGSQTKANYEHSN